MKPERTFVNLLVLPLALLGCRMQSTSPRVGDCADYPEGVYDYGEIGIGRCLAGPTTLRWWQPAAEPGRSILLVGNANPWLDFTGGSVLALDLSEVPTDGRDVQVHEVAASALSLGGFPGEFDLVPDRELMLVTNRFSEDARRRVGFDELYFVDISNPDALDYAPVGPEGATHITLMSDPDALVYDPASGLAFVENFTSHTISVVDAQADPIDVIDAVDRDLISPGRFIDADGSGSRVEIATLEVVDSELVVDQAWSMVFAEGSTRAWVPGPEGVARWTTSGDGLWRASGLGLDMAPEDTAGLVEGIADPQPFEIEGVGFMLFVGEDTGAVHVAQEGSFLGNWAYTAGAALSPREGDWDAQLGGPMVLRSGNVSWLYYDGVDASGEGGVGLASALSASDFRRVAEGPVVAPGNGAHDLVRAADPYVVYDDQAEVWRMFYGAFDGARWTIGHAESDDLLTWIADDAPVFALDGVDLAAPAVAYVAGEWRLWVARRADGDDAWSVGFARSPDGLRWTDEGVTLDIEGSEGLTEPPGVGLQAQSSESWGLYGDTYGPVGFELSAGVGVSIASDGLRVQLSAGARLGPDDAGDAGANGVQLDSVLPEVGLAWLTLTGDDGVQRIGVADWRDGEPALRATPVLEGRAGAFDAAGVSNAVVFEAPGGGFLMLYAGSDGEVTSIGLARSTDGLTWVADDEPALSPGEDWDSLRVVPGSVLADEDGYTLFFAGSDTDTRARIGEARSTDGLTWARVEGEDDPWTLGIGSPGQFDDTAVRHPQVLRVDGVEHLWYAANDGVTWRVGHASRAEGERAWTRSVSPLDGEPRAVLSGRSGSFDALGVQRPVVVDDGGLLRVFYTGVDGSAISRVGLAEGLRPDRLYRVPARPTTGDRVEWTTWLGDGGQDTAIDLGRRLEGATIDGIRVNGLTLDAERGFLYVTSRASPTLSVLDIRDDSTADWRDANHLDFEALLVGNADVGAVGFRGVVTTPGSDLLYALNDNPESVMIIDMAPVVDDDRADVVTEAVVGVLPAARGQGRDRGVANDTAIGPIRGLRVGELLFVANYSDNSIGVYDLRLGAFGALIEEIEVVGENPHAMALSPDGRTLAVANYVGEAVEGERVSSTLALIDVDPESPTYLDIVARIVNQ